MFGGRRRRFILFSLHFSFHRSQFSKQFEVSSETNKLNRQYNVYMFLKIFDTFS